MKCRRLALLLVPAALTLAACSSATDGTGHVAAQGGGGTVSGGPTLSQPSGSTPASGGGAAPVGLSALVSKMRAAVAEMTSAHLTMNITAAGQSITGSGQERLDHGKLVAMDLTMNLAQIGSLRMIVVDGKSYVQLPTSLDTTGKPFILVTENSSNPVVRSMAGSLDSTLSSASLGSYATMMTAARSFKELGPATVAGTATTHYSIVIDVSKLPSNLPGLDAIQASGIADLPLDLYVDGQGRMIQMTEQLSTDGQQVSTQVTVTDYNQPVSISAPPADQVSTG
ncbi:MAG: hypothetical protein J0H43_04030 [Actinobacteria bacterium]|nr:hypothetical protein [Actinomycetota bacterium]